MSFKKHSHDHDEDEDQKHEDAPVSKAVAPPAVEELDVNGDPIALAAVTLTVGGSKFNVCGSLRQQIYKITGASGDTLDIGLSSIKKINMDAPLTGYTLTSLALGRTRITFTASGAFTGAGVEILGN